MDEFESRFAATLKEIAARQPVSADASGVQPRPGPSPAPPTLRRGHRFAPLLAAAAVAAIVSVGAWQIGIRDTNTQETGLSPAEPGGHSPSQSVSEQADQGWPSRDEVTAVTEELSSFYSTPGFGKVIVDYASSTVTVFWHGSPPEQVNALEGTQPNGVRVVVATARYSEADLVATGMAVQRTGSEVFGPDAIAATYPNEDLSGLVVEATTPRVTADSLADALDGTAVVIRLVEGTGALLNDD